MGGRWNPPDRAGRAGFGALYLNATIETSKANARRHVRETYAATLEDLRASRRPDLQEYDVTPYDFVDAVTFPSQLGLSATYPIEIPHAPCQGIAEEAYSAMEAGIVALSAVSPNAEELVIFDREVLALTRKTQRIKFELWY